MKTSKRAKSQTSTAALMLEAERAENLVEEAKRQVRLAKAKLKLTRKAVKAAKKVAKLARNQAEDAQVEAKARIVARANQKRAEKSAASKKPSAAKPKTAKTKAANTPPKARRAPAMPSAGDVAKNVIERLKAGEQDKREAETEPETTSSQPD
jgi:hypothetical protein